MEYISVKDAAAKWGVSTRWVQMCCKEGQIKGAQHFGKSWMIPANEPKPERKPAEVKQADLKAHRGSFMPLTATAYEPGECLAHINSLSNEIEKNLYLAEYYYYQGDIEKSIEYSVQHLEEENLSYKLTAFVVYGYANFSLGRVKTVMRLLRAVEDIYEAEENKNDPYIINLFHLIKNIEDFILHRRQSTFGLSAYKMAGELKLFTEGIRLFGCYMISNSEYRKDDYSKALGVAEAAMCAAGKDYPIMKIYLSIMAAASNIAMKNREEAIKYMVQAWDIAKKDKLYQFFAIHYNILLGLVEAVIRKDDPKAYREIIEQATLLAKTHRANFNPDVSEELFESLSPMELVIAMLASKGWSNKEIANHMEISPNTVKYHMSVVFQKMQVLDRKQLQNIINI